MEQPKQSKKRPRSFETDGEPPPPAKIPNQGQTLRPEDNPSNGVYKNASLERSFFGTNGKAFESEHTVGYSPLADGMPRKGTTLARSVENNAPAYLEEYSLHRAHIGTGTRNQIAESGFNSESYRTAQHSLLVDGDMSSAVQLNQLDYAFQPAFKSNGYNPNSISNQSYVNMVDKMAPFQFVVDKNTQTTDTLSVNSIDKAEMYLSRQAAQTGEFPTREEENEARGRYGLEPLPDFEEDVIEPLATSSATPTLSSSSAVNTDPNTPSLKRTQASESTSPSLQPASSAATDDAAAQAQQESSLMEQLAKLPSPPTTDPASTASDPDAAAGDDSLTSDAAELLLA